MRCWRRSRATRRAGSIETLSTMQQGAIATPTAGYFRSWVLWWRHRALIRRFRQGDVTLTSVEVARTRIAVFGLMGTLTSATGMEVALLRTNAGLVLRLGQESGKANVRGAVRV